MLYELCTGAAVLRFLEVLRLMRKYLLVRWTPLKGADIVCIALP
jgi:hypothetical protein